MTSRSTSIIFSMVILLCSLAFSSMPGYSQPILQSVAPVPSPKYEARAVWLTTLKGLDWPRTQVRQPSDTLRQQAELTRMLNRMQAAGINIILLQTRVRGSVIYPSAIEPWDVSLTGTYDVSPGYDPLAFAIRECHKRGMQLHAWVVAFPLADIGDMRKQKHRAIANKHPELCLRAGDKWIMNPGEPGTADYLVRLCTEIAGRYDIDGIHLDYIRYPERGITYSDAATYRKYGGGRPIANWRTDNVTRVVRAIAQSVRRVKPWLRMSSSPVGKYADLPRQSAGGWNARDAVYQDAALWLREGLMDMLFPMMYFTGANFYPFALDWSEASCGRTIAPGLGVYFLAKAEKDWAQVVIRREMNFLRAEGMGQAYFRAAFVDRNVKGLYELLSHDFYAAPALIPPMTWHDSIPPSAPAYATSSVSAGTRRLAWASVQPDAEGAPVTYNLYLTTDSVLDVSSPTALHRVSLRDTHYTFAPALPALLHARMAVTTVDAYGNESAPTFFE